MKKILELLSEATKLIEEKASNCNCNQETEVVEDSKVELSTVAVGEIIESNGNEYKVLEHFDDGTSLVISNGFMLEDVVFDSNYKDYYVSNVKKRIDAECLPIFEADFGAENIVEHNVDLTSVDMQNEFGQCTCKARLITFDEARRYNDLLVNNNLDDWWWTCTPWSTKERGYEYSIAVVRPSGGFRCNCYYDAFGVRPVCILKSNIFVSKKGE